MTLPSRAELYAAIALAALTIAAALGLGRVFDEGSFAWPVIGAALIPHTVGLVARTRRWNGVVLGVVTAVAVLLYLAWVIAPGSTTWGIPGPGTMDVLGRRLSSGWDVFRTGRAPVPVTDGVLLLCMLLTAVVATTADLLAFRSEATLAAIVPSLLLFVFASTLGTTELRTATTLGYSIVALVFLMLQHQALLERHRSWASGRRLGSHATWINAAGLVGGVALLAGLVIAPALPGADDGPLLDYRNLGGSSSGDSSDFRTLSPLVDLKSQLTERPDVELFRVDAPTRLYWRIAALDRFDGRVWGIESQARDVGDELDRRRPPNTVRQRYTITALADRWLPAAYEPVATDLERARVVPESGTLVAPQDITGLTYRVDSRVTPAPSEATIDATLGPLPNSVESSLELPDSFPESVRARAQRIVAGELNPYRRAVLLQDFFTGGDFTYDLRGVPEGSGTDAITAFLEARRGFCEQFAGAYAAMARSIGLPTRVAVGFTAGEYDEGAGEFSVRARNAHAWPEVYLTGMGWTQFEPTPAGGEPGMADAAVGEPASAGPTTPTTPTTTSASTTPTTGPGPNQAPRGGANVQTESLSDVGTGGSDDRWLVLVAIAGLALVAAIVWLAARAMRKVRRRTSRRRQTIPAHSVAGAWQDALERLTDAGLPPSETLTPHEQVESYSARGAPEDAARSLGDLAEIYARAGWSWREPTEDDVERAWSDADAVRAALAEGASSRERMRRALRV